jgi:hypothetical protein
MTRREHVRHVLPLLIAAGCTSCGDRSSAKPETTASPPASVTLTPAAAAARPLPPGRSPIPSLAEYAAAREVTVKGSTALHCETKMIREWLRVRCSDKDDTGGAPTAVTVTRGGGETLVFAAAGVTSVITPVLPGTDFEAVFSWTDKAHHLVVKWARGAPHPVVVGEFLGAASPLDGTAPSAAICECHRRLTGRADCSEAPFAQPDCERSFPGTGNCDRLLACARGEPGAAPSCPPGKRNAGTTGWCAPVCGPGRPPCGAGAECSHDWGEPPVCL